MTASSPAIRGPSALVGLIWIAIWGFSGFFLNYSTMVPISTGQGLSPVTGGTLLTIMMVSVVGIQPVAPALRRRLGPRRTVGTALVLMAAGQFAGLVVPHAVTALLLTGLAVGCGFGVLVVVATAAVPRVARPGRVGRALGLFGASTAAAAAIGAPLGLWLSNAVPLGTFRLVAGAMVLVALATLPAIPARPSAAVSAPGPAPDPAHPADSAHAASPEAAHASGPSWAGLVPALLPFLVGMVGYGLVIAFGPGGGAGGGGGAANPALFIATMQGSSVVGRWLAGAVTDRRNPAVVYGAGIAMTVGGLVALALVPAGWPMAGCLVALGLGVGTVQSASLVVAFARAGDPGRASVAWNMSFDIGLGLAGLVGGLGFTYLGSAATLIGCALLMIAAGLVSRLAAQTGTK